ncbi:MAG TPA: 50S ribosomal protein L11 methyltransferase, partial [Aquifex aeolicus]|nr:50S ribosomal protein L11 methyltransferase [Aquifex aeolicus]
MKIKRFIYCLPEEEFLKFVYDNSVSVEVVKRKEGVIYFAVYKKIDNLKPVKVEEISDDWKNWKENFKPIEIEDFIILPP